MIKVVRVDHRLVHGQIIYSWLSSADINTIFVVNDNVVKNDARKNALRMVKPSNIKMVIKSVKDSIEAINSGVTDKYNMMVICENVSDAYSLITNTSGITSLNLGGTLAKEDTKQYYSQINLSKEDVYKLNDLVDRGIEVEVRMVPKDKKQIYEKKQ